jgi:hypothetical protein
MERLSWDAEAGANGKVLGVPLGVPVGAKPCGLLMTDEETDAEKRVDDVSPQVLSLQMDEDY